MHELAIAKGIIDIVNSEAREKGFRKVLEIKLSIGEYSGIIPDCLREFFPYAAAGTPADVRNSASRPWRGSFSALTAAMRAK